MRCPRQANHGGEPRQGASVAQTDAAGREGQSADCDSPEQQANVRDQAGIDRPLTGLGAPCAAVIVAKLLPVHFHRRVEHLVEIFLCHVCVLRCRLHDRDRPDVCPHT